MSENSNHDSSNNNYFYSKTSSKKLSSISSSQDKTLFSTEKTEVLYGEEDVTNLILQIAYHAKERVNTCGNSQMPSVAIAVEPFRKAIVDAKGRGVRLRYVTEITNDNLSYCKQLSEIVELRHLDNIKGNFAITENEYVATAVLQQAKPVSQAIYSNAKSVLEQHQYLFETLWDKATPAEKKIREIEEDIEPEFYHVIANRQEAGRILFDLAKSIKKEALILLPNDKSMVRLDRLGVIDYTINASQQNAAEVKIICPLSQVNFGIVKRISDKAPNIKILNGNNSPYGMYIVDSQKFFRAELREPNAEELSEAIGFTVYSNSKVSVSSFRSVFELLWNERMINEELKRADKMQKEFINIALMS